MLFYSRNQVDRRVSRLTELSLQIGFISVLLLLSLINIMTANSAWAEDLDDSKKLTASIPITHTLYTNAAADLSGIVYTLELEPQALQDTSVRIAPSDVSTWIGGHKVTFTLSGDNQDAPNPNCTEWTKTYAKLALLEDLFGPVSNFGNAGVYGFKAFESATGGTSNAKIQNGSDIWKNASERYFIRVYVENDSVSNDLKYAFATISSLTPTGDIPDDDTNKKTGLSFSSRYNASQTLNLSKVVAGAYADNTQLFSFNIALYLPDWTVGAISDFVTSDATLAPEYNSGFKTVEDTSTLEPAKAKKVVYVFSLSDGDAIIFTVPVGTRYRIEENESSFNGIDYRPATEWVVDSQLPHPSSLGVTQLPSKIEYDDGDVLERAGLEVTAYYDDGSIWGVVPLNELSLSPLTAIKPDTLTTRTSSLNTGTITKPIPAVTTFEVETKARSYKLPPIRERYDGHGHVFFFAFVSGRGIQLYAFSKTSGDTFTITETNLNTGEVEDRTYTLSSLTQSSLGPIASYSVYRLGSGDTYIVSGAPPSHYDVGSTRTSNAAATVLYGDIVTDGRIMNVDVEWIRPNEGENLSTSFNVLVE